MQRHSQPIQRIRQITQQILQLHSTASRFIPPPLMSLTDTPDSPLVRLLAVVQQYEWGKIGLTSAVASLQHEAYARVIDSSQPYAELWMGTHNSGPSSVAASADSAQPIQQQSLKQYLKHDLPFLFKVLSVGKSLSIQAHPDMSLARSLHSSRPSVYKDPFHKPELAVALTPFEAMCAFRPLEQILALATENEEFRTMMGEQNFERLVSVMENGAGEGEQNNNSNEKKAVLKSIFSAMMTPTPELLDEQLKKLISRLQAAGVKPSIPTCDQTPSASSSSSSSSSASSSSASAVALDIPSLILRLHSQYPGDVGLFAPFFLNCFVLRPGAAIFLGPNEPHAYLSGDCVECMACSDNVVRAGLTPKFRDTQVLIDMLTYESRRMEDTLMKREQLNQFSLQFAPPPQFNEFKLMQHQIAPSAPDATFTLPPVSGASILLVWSGSGELRHASTGQALQLTRGLIVLVPHNSKVNINTQQGKGITMYQCAENI